MKVLEKYKKYLNLLWIVPMIIVMLYAIKNIKFITNYYKVFQNNHSEFSFSIFNKPIENDTFFTLAIGRYISEHGHDNMDHLTWHENLRFPHSGVFDFLLWKIYQLSGFDGITIFVSIMTICIFCALFLVIKNQCKNWKIALICAISAVYISRLVFVARAQIISFLLFILEYFCIEKLLETNKKRYGVFLIMIHILIANLHSSVFLISFVFYLPYLAENFLYIVKEKLVFDNTNQNRMKCACKKVLSKFFNKFKMEKKENIKSLWMVLGIAVFTGLCTNTGVAPYTDMIKAMIGVSTDFIADISHTTFSNNSTFFYLVIGMLSIIVFTKVKPKITDIFYLLGFCIMTLNTYRCFFFFVLIGIIPFANIITEFLQIYPIQYKAIKVGITISFIVIVITVGLKQFWYNQSKKYISEKFYPVKVADYILENLDVEHIRIYNEFTCGSYLEFKGIKAFIDSRSGMFCAEFNPGVTILEDWIAMKDGRENYKVMFSKYNFTHAVVKYDEIMYEEIKNDNDWNLLYEEGGFALFERK